MFASGKAAAVSSEANYIEDVFSTWLYTGNGSTQTITNGIDLAGDGGLVWIKARNVGGASRNNRLWTTNLGGSGVLQSDSTAALYDYGSPQVTFNSNGFGLSSDAGINFSGDTFASWTFRKQPKFFDVVTFTGDGTTNRSISHSLGSVPGAIWIKRTDSTGNWGMYQKVSGYPGGYTYFSINTTDAAGNFIDVPATSTTFEPYKVQSATGNTSNINGATYVAYLFADNAGGFGLTGTDNVISCGSFTTDGSGTASVTLGYEPQWVLLKSATSAVSWVVLDTMRGWVNGSGASFKSMTLQPNSSAAEAAGTIGSDNLGSPTATGFTVQGVNASDTMIYIAIRRGPMKVPTSGTSVFAPTKTSATDGTAISVGFPTDSQWANYLAGDGNNTTIFDRLRGMSSTAGSTSQNRTLFTSNTSAESSSFGVNYFTGVNNTGWVQGSYASGVDTVRYDFRRAPSFFDVVCGTSASSGQTWTSNHNLGVSPELVIMKTRGSASSPDDYWWVAQVTANKFGILNTNGSMGAIGSTLTVSATSFTGMVGYIPDNTTMVAYLFASCAGVSKVGSYTGTGATQTIDCGFTGGARFVLIKRTNATGDWCVWDTSRGMVSGTDPRIFLNSSSAGYNNDWVYTTTGGFQIVTSDTNVNASGSTYIYLAIA